MLGLRTVQTFAAGSVITALLCGAAYSFSGTTFVAAELTDSVVHGAQLDRESRAMPEVLTAAKTFIRGMSTGNADVVWLYASEEDQAAFGSEDEILSAFADAFPALTEARELSMEKSWQEGDTPFVAFSMTDESGTAHRVTLGVWLDDAGDWKVVSCEVAAVSDRVASL